tara:strand:- start:29122 stop:29547 length:426 start_codon:yes stop_codon:yes gene_type:complete
MAQPDSVPDGPGDHFDELRIGACELSEETTKHEQCLLKNCAESLFQDMEKDGADVRPLFTAVALINEGFEKQDKYRHLMNVQSSIQDWYEDETLLNELLQSRVVVQDVAYTMVHVLLDKMIEVENTTILGALFADPDRMRF